MKCASTLGRWRRRKVDPGFAADKLLDEWDPSIRRIMEQQRVIIVEAGCPVHGAEGLVKLLSKPARRIGMSLALWRTKPLLVAREVQPVKEQHEHSAGMRIQSRS